MGEPYFCKYVCPQGILEGAIPLSLADVSIRAALGTLFYDEVQHSGNCRAVEHYVLSSFLQMDLPAWSFLFSVQSHLNFTVSS